MQPFLSELGKKLAERWLMLLVVPGLGYCAAAVVAQALGHQPADVLATVQAELARLSAAARKDPLLAVLSVLLASAGVALLASAGSTAVRLLWLGNWPGTLGRPLLNYRIRRWDRWHRAYETAVLAKRGGGVAPGSTPAASLAVRRNRVGLVEPQRPTWIGDRFAAAQALVMAEYGVDLAVAWPRLWLLMSEEQRAELRVVWSAFTGAATLLAWGVLYGLLAAVSWPFLLLGAVPAVVAWRRGRLAAAAYADLVESVVDLYLPGLADAMGVPPDTPPERAGRWLNRRMHKGT
ncbi:hypothetical protein GCM10022251_76360 [Phytohabitans flavus]|uniref:Uncharacterized protein n=1 Tax=Phytohabitans flavus TaxID=1076124 RepID=A0A6F8XSX0_9ACTN|nr:hypothetical protein [Phytohabitans flavus]BCB76916.1 hypothetical protein Pflav_033260 [Phytohabitans flavus]